MDGNNFPELEVSLKNYATMATPTFIISAKLHHLMLSVLLRCKGTEEVLPLMNGK